MALNIRNKECELLAARLARLTGETKTEAITRALIERLVREERKRRDVDLVERLTAIAKHCASLPVFDDRSPDEILGYDENGLPT